jgi:hypothetical protein
MNYKIEIWSRGIDVGIGKITQEQYEYWNDRDTEDLNDVLNNNFDYDENETPAEARFNFEYYNECDDVFFGFGPDHDYNEMTIKDSEGNILFMGDISGFVNEYDPDYEVGLLEGGEQDYYSNCLEPGHYIQWCQGGKGLYFDGEFDAEKFDPLKMVFSIRETDYGEIVVGLAYDGEDVENQAGDYDIKSFEASVFHAE